MAGGKQGRRGGKGRDLLGGVKQDPNAVLSVVGQSGKTQGPLDGLISFDDFKKVQPSPFL